MFDAQILSVGDKVLYNGKVDSVMLPGVEGEFEVVDFHGPIAALLATGMITVMVNKKSAGEYSIEQGVMRFDGKNLFAIVE